MRNVPVALTPEEAAAAAKRKGILTDYMGRDVTLNYVKRDGTPGSSTGTVTSFNGTDGTDTMSVIVECADKGRRTINISRITNL